MFNLLKQAAILRTLEIIVVQLPCSRIFMALSVKTFRTKTKQNITKMPRVMLKL